MIDKVGEEEADRIDNTAEEEVVVEGEVGGGSSEDAEEAGDGSKWKDATHDDVMVCL